MPTEKPGVMTYVDPGLYKQLVALKEERGARSPSQTVEEILEEYVGSSISSTMSNSVFLEQNRRLVEQVDLLVEGYQSLQKSVIDLQKIILKFSVLYFNQLNSHNQGIEIEHNAQKIIQTDRTSNDSLSMQEIKENSAQIPHTLIEGGLKGIHLAKRLNVDSSTLSRRRSKSDFSEWTQQLDPDKISWFYVNFDRRFYPEITCISEREELEIELGIGGSF